MQLNNKKLARDPRFDSKKQQRMVGQQGSGDVYTQNTHTHTHLCDSNNWGIYLPNAVLHQGRLAQRDLPGWYVSWLLSSLSTKVKEGKLWAPFRGCLQRGELWMEGCRGHRSFFEILSCVHYGNQHNHRKGGNKRALEHTRDRERGIVRKREESQRHTFNKNAGHSHGQNRDACHTDSSSLGMAT